MSPIVVAMLQKIRELENAIKAEQVEYQQAVKASRSEDATRIRASVEKNVTQFKYYRALLAQATTRKPGVSSNVAPQGTGDAGTSAADTTDKSLNIPNPGAASGSATTTAVQVDVPVPTEVQNTASGSQSQSNYSQNLPPQPPAMPAGGIRIPNNLPPDVALQMQKLVEQQRRVVPPQTSPQPMINNNTYPMQPQPPTLPMNNSDAQMWQGSFTWSGSDPLTGNKKDVSAQVIFSRTTQGNLYVRFLPASSV